MENGKFEDASAQAGAAAKLAAVPVTAPKEETPVSPEMIPALKIAYLEFQVAQRDAKLAEQSVGMQIQAAQQGAGKVGWTLDPQRWVWLPPQEEG